MRFLTWGFQKNGQEKMVKSTTQAQTENWTAKMT